MTAVEREAPLLAHERVAAGEAAPDHWLYVLHGIYGAGRNWRSVASRLARARPEWGAVLVDLRLHGDSPALPPPHTVEACAADVARLARSLDAAAPLRALLGHSFGGKVALRHLADTAGTEGQPRQVWVVDSIPGAREPRGAAVRMLAAVREHPGPFESREEAAAAIRRHGFPRAAARWMTTNMERRDGVFRWSLDWDAMEALLEDFFREELWSVVETPPAGAEIHVVSAEGSGIVDPDTAARIESASDRTGRVHLHRLEGGHWLNISNPDGMLALLRRHLPGAEAPAADG